YFELEFQTGVCAMAWHPSRRRSGSSHFPNCKVGTHRKGPDFHDAAKVGGSSRCERSMSVYDGLAKAANSRIRPCRSSYSRNQHVASAARCGIINRANFTEITSPKT